MYNYAREVNNNKTAIITGSGRGIGREAAIILAKKSVNVVVCSRTLNEISSTVQEIKKVGCNSKVIGSKTIDILVNNAGVAFNRLLRQQVWTLGSDRKSST